MTSTAATDLYWEKLTDYLGHACALFGLPAQLAEKLWLSREQRKRFNSIIRPLEDAVRRLIFIAALQLAPMTLPPAPERKWRNVRAFPTNTGAYFDPAKPETWRVSFKLHLDRRYVIPGRGEAANPEPAGKHADNARHPCRQDAGAPISSAPSAERLEALIRCFNNRDKLAAALAYKMARNARVANAFIARPRDSRASAPVAALLFELSSGAQDAYKRFTQHRLHTWREATHSDSS